jgi:hypothetical protein
MDKRPRSGEGEPKEHRSALRWFLLHWEISYLLGVEQDEPPRVVPINFCKLVSH